MKIKTNELTGPALEWAVARVLGKRPSLFIFDVTKELAPCHRYSTDWSQGGPIIEREMKLHGFDVWQPRGSAVVHATYERGLPDSYISGPTPLIAAMRCYVMSKLGEEVEVPDELLESK